MVGLNPLQAQYSRQFGPGYYVPNVFIQYWGMRMNHLIPFWFIVIAILWTGFFILEGFDFGVGMLHSVVGTDEAGRRLP